MSERAPYRRLFVLVVCGLTAASVCALVACGGDETAPTTTAAGSSGGGVVADPPEVEDPEPPPEVEAPQATWSDDTYELTSTATGPYAVGVPSTFEVRLTPRGEYHVNTNYPWSVTVTPPAAVLVPTATFDSTTAAEMTETVARFVVPFTPTAAGSHEVTAAVDYGICREEACIFQMHTVLVTVVAADGVAADGVIPPGTPPAIAPGEPAPSAPLAPPAGATSALPIPAAAEAGGRS